MNRFFRSLSIAVALSASAAFPTQAIATVYVGSQQVGAMLATYSIVTDGTIGAMTEDNILSYSTTLSDALSSFTFGTATGAYALGFFKATSLALSISGDAGIQFIKEPAGAGAYPGDLSFYLDTVRSQISDEQGTRAYIDSFSNPFAVAVTTAPGVPEPASWAMMITGFGTIGLVMRRRQKANTVLQLI
jgi:hypothetical protein